MENRKEIAKQLSELEEILSRMHPVLRGMQKNLGADGVTAVEDIIDSLLTARGQLCDLIEALKGGTV